ncbi:Cyclic nucleotide-binding domain family protein [Leishmania donovani]|uniref:Cyclic nucleotide-binding domain family protein n=1 Tax=Leishmania donovani TaxID=5661 RepID=A0A504X076_LEIDO|nr:Cyclic nucleotide-binding domain family protein [Leishmania donovani]
MWQWRQPPWESPEEWQVLRRVLCGHPLFAACRDDASMLRDVMEVFERQETQPGEVIASPGDSCAFHVVVKGQAVADVGDGDAVIAQAKNKRQEWAVGDYFGSEGLLYVLNPDDEGAAVCAAGHPDASSPTATWRLNRMLYQMLMRTFYDDAHLQLMKYFSSRRSFSISLRGGGGHAGVPRVQSIVLGAGDCVGDAELLLLHRAADEEDVTTASKRLIAMHSLCTYAVQKPVQAIRIPIEDLLAVLSGHDLQHMRERSRSVRELELWQRQAQMPGGLRSLVDECLVLNISNPNSDSDSDSDEDSLVLQGGPARLSDDASQDVFVKGADATAFFLEQMFSRQTYRRADGRERGLSMATFAPRQRYLVGTVLFHVEYAASGNGMMRASGGLPPSDDGKGAASTAGSSAAAGSRKSHGCLYAVFSGEVTVVNSDTGEAIYSVSRGNTLGEEALLAPLRCCSATNPLRTHAVVSSSDGCEVFELSWRAFKEFLQRPYCEALRDFCSVFCVFPFAWCFPQHYWHFLFNCTTEREAVGGDLIGVRGADCKCVSLILDGRLDAYARSSAADSGGKEQDHDEETSVASFAAGDIVGGWEVMEGRPCNVAYVCVCRTRMLCVPAESFAGLFRPAMPYLRLMWSERRYKRVMVVSATEG